MSGYAEHNMIRRGRIGVSDDSSDFDAKWAAGVNSLSFAEASALRAQTMQAMASGFYTPSAAARASIAKWDAYAQKYGAVTKLTPEQFKQYQAQGSYDRATGQVSLTGGGSNLGLLSKIPFVGPLVAQGAGLLGLNKPTAQAPVQQQGGGGFLDAILSPVGLVIGVVVTGAGAYAATRGKSGKKKGARRR